MSDVCASERPGGAYYYCELAKGHAGNHAVPSMDATWPAETAAVSSMCLHEQPGGQCLCELTTGHSSDHQAGGYTFWLAEPETQKQDPNEGETEAKLDKIRMELIDLNFVADMATQLQKGIRAKRVPWGWTQYDPEEFVPLLRGSFLRHLRATETGLLAKDSDTEASHWAAIAVNAMMCWGLERIEAGIDKVRG